MPDTTPALPLEIRLAVSVSLMLDSGDQPISGADGVIPDTIQLGLLELGRPRDARRLDQFA
jgi:hypothetical protein